ncbi:MAG: Zn-dependent protease, partial [Frankiales bacterium]|nr:Zn-dependent protease [Frankiales bacterium]
MTWTILAKDRSSGQLGIATTTHAFGVGPVADWAQPGVAVAATQAWVDVSYGPLGLKLIEAGLDVHTALDQLLAADDHSEIRQVAFLDAAGDLAHFTGAQ